MSDICSWNGLRMRMACPSFDYPRDARRSLLPRVICSKALRMAYLPFGALATSHGLLLLSQGARRLMVVRVLHMFTCRRNDYAPSAVPKSNSRFRPDAAHLSSFRIRAARRRRFGQMQYRPHGTNARFWPGLQPPPRAIERGAARWAQLSVMLLDQQLSGERVSILPGGSNEA